MEEPPSLREEIAHRVRTMRTERGWSQADLAERMAARGFSWARMTVTEVEGRRGRPVSVEELLGLAYVFNVGIKFVLGLQFWKPPTSPSANLIRLTPAWAVHRRDLASVIDTGQPAREKYLLDRVEELMEEERTLHEVRADVTQRLQSVADQIGRLKEEIVALMAGTEEEQ